MQENLDLDSIIENEDGSLELPNEEELEGDKETFTPTIEQDFDSILGINLADSAFIEPERMSSLAREILDGFIDDLDSNQDYFESLKEGVDLLGIKLNKTGDLGDWSCGASHPLLIENAIKLQAMASTEIDPPDGPVRTRIFGAQANPDAESIAKRKQDYLNWQLTYKSDTFYPESEKVWLLTALFGTAFKANYWDSKSGSLLSQCLRPDQVILNKCVKTIKNCDRYTCILPSSDVEIAEKMKEGYFRQTRLDTDYNDEDGELDVYATEPNGGAGLDSSLNSTLCLEEKLNEIIGSSYESDRVLLYTYVKFDANRVFLTQEEEDEITESGKYTEAYYLPFLLITELKSGKVLGFYANWTQGDTTFTPLSYVTDFHLIRAFGFYSLGYIHILGNFQKMLTSIMRSIVDSGTLANLQGGFKLKGTKIGGTKRITPGEFIDVEASGGDISKVIMNLGFKEPSAILTQMYQILEGRGQMFANATEGVVKDSTNYGKVGTTLALLDASSKLTTSIIRNFHRQRRRELESIVDIIKENVTSYPYDIEGVKDREEQFKQDFFSAGIEIVPVSDANIPNSTERLAMAQQRVNFAQMFPQVHDLRTTLLSVYKAMGQENPDRFLPPPQEAKPQDPVSDIMSAVRGQPIGAFPGQAHEAYITVFNNWIQLPETQQNQAMIPAIGAITSASQQHAVLSFQEKVQGMMQQPSGANEANNPNVAAMLQANASKRILDVEKALAEQAMDPTSNLDSIKAKTALVKSQSDLKQADSREKIEFAKLALEQEKLALEKEKLAKTTELGNNQIIANLSDKDAQRAHDMRKTKESKGEGRLNMAMQLLQKAAEQDHQIKLAKETKPKKE